MYTLRDLKTVTPSIRSVGTYGIIRDSDTKFRVYSNYLSNRGTTTLSLDASSLEEALAVINQHKASK